MSITCSRGRRDHDGCRNAPPAHWNVSICNFPLPFGSLSLPTLQSDHQTTYNHFLFCNLTMTSDLQRLTPSRELWVSQYFKFVTLVLARGEKRKKKKSNYGLFCFISMMPSHQPCGHSIHPSMKKQNTAIYNEYYIWIIYEYYSALKMKSQNF